MASTRGRGSNGDGKLYMVFRHILKIESIGMLNWMLGLLRDWEESKMTPKYLAPYGQFSDKGTQLLVTVLMLLTVASIYYPSPPLETKTKG